MKVEQVQEHEDGSATFHFDMNESEREFVLEIGLRAILTSVALGINVDEMLQKIMESRE